MKDSQLTEDEEEAKAEMLDTPVYVYRLDMGGSYLCLPTRQFVPMPDVGFSIEDEICIWTFMDSATELSRDEAFALVQHIKQNFTPAENYALEIVPATVVN